MRVHNFQSLVGNTPAIQFFTRELPADCRLWIKMEGCNPTGSVKDRACLANIKDAIFRGSLKNGMTILDASSGNMACSLAYFGKILGYPVTVVCGSKLTPDKEKFIKFFGAELIPFGEFTMEANTYCREKLATEFPDRYCFLDQLHNWSNPRATYDTLAPELCDDFPVLTAIVGSLGSGGTMYGLARYFRDCGRETKIVTVEAASGARLPGTGSFIDGDYVTPFIKKGTDDSLFLNRKRISLNDAAATMKELRRHGFFVGLQTGGVVHAAIEEIKAFNLKGDVVAISGDSGWKNLDILANIPLIGSSEVN